MKVHSGALVFGVALLCLGFLWMLVFRIPMLVQRVEAQEVRQRSAIRIVGLQETGSGRVYVLSVPPVDPTDRFSHRCVLYESGGVTGELTCDWE